MSERAPGALSLAGYGPGRVLYIAHRGGALVHPEHTLEAYRAACSAGAVAIEPDVQLLADGALGVMHDATVDRTTTASGDVARFDTAAWHALAIDANDWHGSSFGNALTPPLFSEVLAEFGGRVVLVPEAKQAAAALPLVAALAAARVPRDLALVQGFAVAAPAAAVVAGYHGMFLTSTCDADDVAAVRAAGIQWVGIDHAADRGVFQGWVAAGIRTAAWTVNRRCHRDRVLGFGVSAIFSDDPVYLQAHVPLATADRFAAQTWLPGMLARRAGLTDAERGRFFPPDAWGWSTAPGKAWVLQGWACPVKGIPAAEDFSIDLHVIFDAASGGDQSRHASLFVCGSSDEPFDDPETPSPGTGGYHIVLRKSGLMQIYRCTEQSPPVPLASSTGYQPAIADGEEVAFRVAVTPDSVGIARLAPDGHVAASALAHDASCRGGYFWLGKDGLACRFRHVAVR